MKKYIKNHKTDLKQLLGLYVGFYIALFGLTLPASGFKGYLSSAVGALFGSAVATALVHQMIRARK